MSDLMTGNTAFRTARAAAVSAIVVTATAAAVPAIGWARVPMRTAAIANAVSIGGEGCQVVRTLAGAPGNASFLLMGTDVGGVYRSLDGGESWHIAMVGWNSRGSTGFAIDPHNNSHVLGIGGNSNGFSGANGIHVSFDAASSWSFVLPMDEPVACLDGQAVAFDSSSFDAATGMSLVAFYSSADTGLWRSNDGGVTWALINRYMLNACVAVDAGGRLYAVSNDYRSYGLYTCGANYTGATGNCSRQASYTTGLDIPLVPGGADPSPVYISNWAGVQRSMDAGATWQYVSVGSPGLPTPVGSTPLHHIAVSPANASHMSVWWSVGASWNTTHAVTHDGGQTWQTATFDDTLAFMPQNGRDGKPVWHPTNASVHFNAGSDWITRSDDGGVTRAWAANGYNGVMVGSSFAFNYVNATLANVMFIAFQDYAGASTLDGGNTWTWRDVSGQGWGGFDYGGFALSATVMWAGNAPSWGGPRNLTISTDGGATWVPALDSNGQVIVFAGTDVSYGDPSAPLVGFASNWRTSDGGATWTAVPGMTAVVTHDMNPQLAPGQPVRLFGISNANGAASVVVSSDHGATFTTLLKLPASSAQDVAYDYAADAVYAVADNSLFKCTGGTGNWTCASLDASLPVDQRNATKVATVAVDVQQPSIVYIGQKMDIYATSVPVACSVDGGATWTNMVLQTPLATGAAAPLQGPHEVAWVRVHPVTRELWAAGECFGVWKAPAPAPAADMVVA